ncbi:lamin tail domain-containing protein [Nocardioides sp. SYSU D00065]|uniref:lamin tail domain-containing protein n=1 Tax=Nocardioides sp. SYSU D00065 TaxID=2817378 RepID=UPI001B3452D8|nr:lamin tail domain-containing protein [Nocardioides sp. SYSU D00065]
MTGPRTKLVTLLAATATAAGALSTTTVSPASAAATDVVINEMMYHAVSDLDGDDYLELTNIGTTPVDLSGWTFSGITLTLPAGTTIAPGGFLVVAKDAAQFQASYGFAPAAVYGGNLSNSGETVSLKDAAGTTIDTVAYGEADPWPVKADGTGPSLELVDARLDNNDFLNWAAATNAAGRTPGAANSVRRSGLGPRITAVTPSTTTPAAGEAVTISATITGHASAVVRYRTDFAAEQTVPMTATGGDTWTATIPGAAAGHLIRYRVQATNATATTTSPRSDDTVTYRGVVVPSGISSPIPQWEWFIAPSDYTNLVNNPTVDIVVQGAIAYEGRVYDNVSMEIKGHASQRDPKVSWKFKTPAGYDFDMPGLLVEPVDELDMQADWSDRSHGRAILSWDAYARAGFEDHTMFPVRTQRNGAFQGLYTLQETYDGTWREREGYDDDQFYEAETSAFSTRPISVQFSKKSPDETDFAPIAAFVSGVRLTGTAQRNHLLANADLPQMLNYAAVTAIVEHHDSASKNFYLAQEPTTGRWRILPWDLDHTLGNGCCNVDSAFVTPAEPGDNTSALMRAILAEPTWRTMYFRRLRTLVDDLLAPGRMEALYDARLGAAQPVAPLDYAAWPYPGNPVSWATFRKRLFDDIAARRTAFANDSRVPGAQQATPDVIVSEIQHSPAGGDPAEFVELYNPGTQAVDLSGWSIGGATALTVQPGTVILPRTAMTFVGNDPAFRAAHGAGVFVGDRFSGALPAAGTLTLTRADGTTADTVTYGGAGWPVPTSGQSLELQDPAADNDLGSSWALSSGAGTPGTPRGAGPVVTAPSAPTVGTATAGNTSATLTWTAPSSDGGAPLTGYLVRVVGPTGAQVGALRPAPASATGLTVTGLTNGTSYRLQVAATNDAGTGAYSALSNSVTPTNTATAPGAPIIGTPSPGPLGGDLTAIARWSAPTSTGGSAITGYRVTALRMSSSAADATVLSRTTSRILGPSVRQREFTLPAGNYRFEVVAINAVGTGPASARSANVVPR